MTATPPEAAMRAAENSVELVIPTYNRPDMLRVAVASALAETPFNVTVLDDGSAAPVDEVLRGLADLRLRVIRNACNLGASLNILRAIEVSRSPYTWAFSDDQTVGPGAADQILKEIRNHPEASVFFWHGTLPTSEMTISSLEPFVAMIEQGSMAFGQSDVHYNRVVETAAASRYVRIDARFSHAQPMLGIQIAALQDGLTVRMRQGALAVSQPGAAGGGSAAYLQRFKFDPAYIIEDARLRARYRAVAARQFPWRAALIDIPASQRGSVEEEYALDAARLVRGTRLPRALKAEAATALWLRNSLLGRLLSRLVPKKQADAAARSGPW